MVVYVDIAGHQTWHEVTGDGPPVLLLHGGFSGASALFAQTPVIAQAGYRVHVPERRGHAHTPDIEGPLTYSVMADDTIAYLEVQVRGPAALIGWSDGAVVALLVAQHRAELVDRMVLIGHYYNSAGRAPDDQIEALLTSPEAMNFLRALYDPYSPDGPEHFPVVYAKTMEMIRTEPEIDLAALARRARPDAGPAGRPRPGHRRTLRRGRGRATRRPARGASGYARPTGRVTGHGQPPSACLSCAGDGRPELDVTDGVDRGSLILD